MWPFRPQRVTLVHEIGPEASKALDALARSLRYAARQDAAAKRYLAKVQAGIIHIAAPPPSPDAPPADKAFNGWLDSQDLSDVERDDLFVFREQVLGRRGCSAEQRARARAVLARAGAPMDSIAP